jgi:hypothetical protein
MLQPHSLLWHYLWVAPNVLLAVLAVLMWKRDLHRRYPCFFVYALFEALQWAVLYPVDLIPTIPAEYYWRLYGPSVLLETLITLVLISEIFATVLGSYTSIARIGKLLIRWMGALLVIAATVTAAYAPMDSRFWLVRASHTLHEAVYLIVCGLIVFLFLFGAYFRLSWSRSAFGIALGIGLSACVSLATWAITANGGLVDQRPLLDFVNMAANHVSVLIWFYYLLAPEKITTTSAVPLPEHNLEVWNRELERLLQQ